MNTSREAPGRPGGRAPALDPVPGSAPDRDLLAALSLDDKVRLLTGADNWRTCPLPGIGLRAMVVSDGPAGVRGVTMDERNPAASLPCSSALGATWDPGLVQALAAALGAEARSKGVDVMLAPTINVMRTPLGGRGLRVVRRGPGADRPDRRGLRPRAPSGGGRRGGQALRGQRLRDRPLDLRRAGRRARAARAVPGPVRGLRARGGRGSGDDRLQPGQRRHHDRARPAARARS